MCLRQRLEIADAEVAGAGLEDIPEGERRERRETARARTPDRQALAVHPATLGQIPGAVHAVVDIDDAPLAVEPLSIGAAEAAAAAVVDVEDGETATAPVLDPEAEAGRPRRTWDPHGS